MSNPKIYLTVTPKVCLTVSEDKALEILQDVCHGTFEGALDRKKHWNVQGDEVCWCTVCWLFVWAKTGQGSDKAAQQARTAFDRILDIQFDCFDKLIGVEEARNHRYEPPCRHP